MRPRMGLAGEWLEDDNELSIQQYGLWDRFWVYQVPLVFEAFGGEISQDADVGRPEVEFDRYAYSLGLDGYRLFPAWQVDAKVTLEDFEDDDEEVWGGKARVTYHRESKARMGAGVSRETFWTAYDRRDARQYGRVTNLSLLDRDETIDTIEAFASRPMEAGFIWGGWSDFEDGNDRLSAYGHYQVEVLDSSADKWTVLRPNLYYEHFAETNAAYYSPDFHVSLGLAGHTKRALGSSSRLEAEINPLLLIRDEDTTDLNRTDFGFQALLDLSTTLRDSVDLGLAGFYYWEQDGYDLWRVVAQVGARF
jgi:hypothetical protein